jgi:hypothetical protein
LDCWSYLLVRPAGGTLLGRRLLVQHTGQGASTQLAHRPVYVLGHCCCSTPDNECPVSCFVSCVLPCVLSCLHLCAQVTGKNPIAALQEHLADPMSTTIFSKAVVVPGQAVQPPCMIPQVGFAVQAILRERAYAPQLRA